MSSFMHTLKIYHFKCKDKLIQIIIALLWSILSFNSFVATLFFLAIISILLSHSSYFNLFFPLISSYYSGRDPNGKKHLSEIF